MKEGIFEWIDKAGQMAVELQIELTKRPAISPDYGGEGELEKCLFLESWLRSYGITQLERFDAPDKRAKGGIRPNLIASIQGSGQTDGCLWVISHLDVVPPGEMSLWNSDPWTLVESKGAEHRLTGRGVEDNQQGIVSSALAALALHKLGLQPRRTLKLLFAADEETGSALGMNWLMENHSGLFSKNDIAVVPDGGSQNGDSIEIAEKNLIWVRFVIKGIQAHGARPDEGANACLAGAELALRLHNELSEIFNERDPLFQPDYSTFEPTKKEANVPNINTIPGEDVFYMDLRILPRYSNQAVLNEIDRIKDEVTAKHRVAISYSLPQYSEAPATSFQSPLAQALSAAIGEVYGIPAHPSGAGGNTIAAFLRRAGIDSAVWSRLNGSAHQPNEFALVENILGDAKVLALLAIT